mgnify:CR=1 FL=1
MFELSVEEEFSGAHRLTQYQGACERLHGHNWKVVLVAKGKRTGKDGLVIDFHLLRRKLREAIAEFDHACLNDLPYFRRRSPSSEEIAKYLFGKLKKSLAGTSARVSAVTVWENARQSATYAEE